MMSEPAENGMAPEEGFEALFEAGLREFETGTIVNGTVIQVGESGVVVDIGYKAEGLVASSEFSPEELDSIKPGDELSVFIVRIDDAHGVVSLSRRRAQRVEIWDRMEEACRTGESVEGVIVGVVKGGVQVDVDGLLAFVPGSQVDLKNVRNFDEYIGQRAAFRVIRTDARRKNAILSRRRVLEDERKVLRRDTEKKLEKDAVLDGRVKNITDYGVFVDLGGIDGLLHVSDISWGRLKHPSEKFSVGDDISVIVLEYDRDNEKVTLGHKQKSPDPWTRVDEKYAVGDEVEGTVVGVADYGAFVEIEEGVEGLIHVSELRWGSRPRRVRDVLSKGDAVRSVVLRVRGGEKRLSLSLKRLQPNPWETVRERYSEGRIVSGTVKNITDFGAFVRLEDAVDGLVHVSDMSWTRHVRHPSEFLRKGDRVDAVVLAVDPARERMSLGIKQLAQDPWMEGISQRFKLGRVYPGRVIRVVDFGVFVEMEGGIEGLVYSSEIGTAERPDDTTALFSPGDEVQVRVVRVDTNERKIGLSMQGLNEVRTPGADPAEPHEEGEETDT